MTVDEYLSKSAAIKTRLTQINRQVRNHIDNGHPKVKSEVLKPLLERQLEIIDELMELDEKFIAARAGP